MIFLHALGLLFQPLTFSRLIFIVMTRLLIFSVLSTAFVLAAMGLHTLSRALKLITTVALQHSLNRVVIHAKRGWTE